MSVLAFVLAAGGYGGYQVVKDYNKYGADFEKRLHLVERVVDGDTFDVRARIWLGQSLVVRVRIAGIDAPELRSRCDAEHILAIEARDYLERRIAGGEVRLSEIAYDKYGGRVLASVGDSAGDIGAAMIAAGLARPYDGGTRTSWCAP